MKTLCITGVFYFLCFCTAYANTPEREAFWKKHKEIREIGNRNDYKSALAMIDDFGDCSAYPDLLCHTFILKAHCYLSMGQPDSTSHYLDEIELLIENHALDSLKTNLYRYRGLIYFNRYDFKSAIPLLLKGLKFAENSDNVRQRMLGSFNIANAYQYTAQLDSSRYYVNKALDFATEQNENLWIAYCKSMLGDLEKRDGNYLKAMENIFEGYSIAKIVRGDTEKTKVDFFAKKLFDVYYGLGNLSASLELNQIIIEHKKSIDHLFNIEAHLLVKSSLLLKIDSLESSALVLNELEQSHQISKNPRYHNQTVALKGGLSYKKKEWDAAEKELSKLLPEIDSASLKSPRDNIAIQGLIQLAQLKLQKGDYKKCLSICEQQLNVDKMVYDLKKQLYGTLATCYKGLEKHSTAYKFLLKRDAVRDTIDRFYEGSLRLSKEQEMVDKQKADEIEKLKYKNELSQNEAAQQRNLISIGGILALLVSGLLFLWGRQRKLVLENSLADVKQQLLKRQVNPHFIFNVLNSIQNSVLTHKKEKSIELISKFSKLTRQVLQNSDKAMVPIHEELLLLTNYMDLEKVRTKNKFDYEVMIDEDIDLYNEEIPSMILQLFVENAIWHGVLPKEEQGLITIKIKRDQGRIKVIIADDGIGREKSLSLKTNDQQKKVSMGMSLIRQRIISLNKKYKDNIELNIKDGKNGKGTQVLMIV